MCPVRLLFVLLCFISVLSTSCEKSDSLVDIALAESMRAMHSAMHAVSFIGKPDGDFASLMIPHHQGAIEMAKVELQFGTDPRLRRLAQEIIVTQQSEIEVMKGAIRDLPPPLLSLKQKNWCTR